jgi:lipopolysaccharide exporter
MTSAKETGDGTASLASKVASGTIWTVGMRMGIRMIGMLSVIIMARLLVPDDFGIVAQASMIYAFVELVTAFGFESALIQNHKATVDHYNTVWTLNVSRGVLNAIALAAVAYPAALILREERLHFVIYFYALASLIRGFANVGTVDFRKQFQFDRDFQFEMWNKVAGFVVSISVAWIWRSYWAFIAGVVSTSVTLLVSSYLMSPFRPRFSLSMWRPLIRFSTWVFTAEMLNAIATKMDVFVLSRFSSVANVGLYTVSFEISQTPSTEVAMPVARALMAGLSRVGDKPDEFRRLYLDTISLVLLVSIPAGVGVSVLANYVTEVALGQKWLGATPLIEILGLFGITRAVIAVSASAFMAYGRVDLMGKVTFVAVVLRIAGVLAGFHYGGLIGLAWGVLFASFGQMLMTLIAQNQAGMLYWSALLRTCWRVVVAAALMAAALKMPGVDAFFAGQQLFVAFVSEVLLGVAVFAAALGTIWRLDGSQPGPETMMFEYIRSRLRTSATKTL